MHISAHAPININTHMLHWSLLIIQDPKSVKGSVSLVMSFVRVIPEKTWQTLVIHFKHLQLTAFLYRTLTDCWGQVWKSVLSSLREMLCPLFVSERLLSGRKVVLRPERLTTDFHQINGTLLMTLRWRMSQQALDPAAVEGFQFTWTLQSGVTTTTERLEDTLISQTQTIAPVRHEERFQHCAEKTWYLTSNVLKHINEPHCWSWGGETC